MLSSLVLLPSSFVASLEKTEFERRKGGGGEKFEEFEYRKGRGEDKSSAAGVVVRGKMWTLFVCEHFFYKKDDRIGKVREFRETSEETFFDCAE